ncbi:MAG: phosphoenolpyruvate--protein phosphotransferase [Spirochaetes bacterium]|nr:phosphoenolpyruvate--protein phosphotransferase [Spirochaetota bacterium]
MEKFKGVGASPGISIGPVHIFDEEKYIIPDYGIDPKDIPSEVKRFKESLSKTKNELLILQKKFLKTVKDKKLDFFKMHILVLEDPYLEQKVVEQIAENRKNAESALFEVMSQYIENLESIQDEYLSERVADLYDISKRIMRNLVKKRRQTLPRIEKPVIIISKELTPTDTAGLNRDKIIGFATDLGGRTSHTAIVARALEIPAVVGLQHITRNINEGDILIIDGNEGLVIVNPDEKVLKEYRTAKGVFEKFSEELRKIQYLQAITVDKKYVKIAGNIEIREGIDSVISHGGEGIGLFRTEFLYLDRSDLPTEKELYDVFKEAVQKIKPFDVIFRTLDIGGDKLGGQFTATDEINPFLGYRAIRFCLENIDIFETQLKAILRASYYGEGKIMFPMVSSVDEILRIKDLIEQLKLQLKKEGKNYKENISIGAMIEIPSAALTSDIISRNVDFLSIGTNDLVQYTMAVDRNNPKISYLYDPYHPAIIRLLNEIVQNAHRHHVKVHVCGELAAEPMAAVLFIGLKVDELSMSAIAIPEVKKIIRSVKYADCHDILNKVLKFETSQKVKASLHKFVLENIPEFAYKSAD